MRLHDRLVLSLCLRVLVFSILGFAILWVLIDVIEKLDDFVEHEAKMLHIARYYFYLLPDILRQTLPVDVLLAAMFTFAVLGKNNELVALLASGVSVLRVARPVFLVALAACGLSYWLAESIVPQSNARMRRTMRVDIEKRLPEDSALRYAVSYRGQGGYLWHAELLNTETKTLKNVEVHQYKDGRVVARLLARSAVWRDKYWEFQDGSYRTFEGARDSLAAALPGPPREKVQEFRVFNLYDVAETPEDLRRIDPKPDEMTRAALERHVEHVRASGGNPNDAIVDLRAKASDPWTSLVLAALGVGLSARKRKSSLVAGFGQTLVIGFGYLMLSQIATALGKNEQLPPLLSAWIGIIAFGATALVLLLRANR